MVGVSGLGTAAGTLARGGELGEALLLANRAGKGVDVAGLSRDLAQLAQRDAKGAADAIESARKGLSPVERGEFDRALPQSIADAQRAGTASPKGLGSAQKELALDLTQMGLDVAGLFDPTPVSDGANGVISLLRGDFLGAGISAVSMIPYIGDAAKLGKLGAWGKTVAHAVEIAKTDSAFAKAAKPALDAIANAIGAAPKKVLDALPQSARDTLTAMKREIDGLGGAAAKKTDDVAGVAVKVRKFDDAASFNAAANHAAPNTRYEYGRYSYTTDAKGRVSTAEGQVKLDATGRNDPALQAEVGHEGRKTDIGFHIIGDRFGAQTNRLNVVPGNGRPIGDGRPNLNQGDYKRFENTVARLAENPRNKVEVRINADYADGNASARPDTFRAEYRVNGGAWRTQTFVNK